MSQHRVAVIQAGSRLFDTPRTLDQMAQHCETAAAEGVELAVFPEAYVGGYPKGLNFGATIGARTPGGREDYLRYWKAAISVPGPETARIGSFAAKMKAHLVVGVIERDVATLYCTALFFGPDGVLLGKHRKLMPTGSERLVWGQGDGSTIPVFGTAIGRIGAAICWENYMPNLRQAMYSKGISLWCAPTVDERDIWQSSMRHIAYEGRTFVLSACQYLTRADAPQAYDCPQGSDPGTVLIRGGSVIVSPMGEILAGPVYGREGVIAANIDLDDTVRGKYDLDVVGHYSRPDVFNLRVDERERQPVSFGRQIDDGDEATPSPAGPIRLRQSWPAPERRCLVRFNELNLLADWPIKVGSTRSSGGEPSGCARGHARAQLELCGAADCSCARGAASLPPWRPASP